MYIYMELKIRNMERPILMGGREELSFVPPLPALKKIMIEAKHIALVWPKSVGTMTLPFPYHCF